MQRKTYAIIDGNILKDNIKKIKKEYSDYQYYFGVVKNNAYHHGMKCVLDMIEGGINYFAVSSLEEAYQLRKYTNYPVLCLEPLSLDFIDDIMNNNVTITVESLDYLKELASLDLYAEVTVHLAIDSGMNRLGFTNKSDFDEAMEIISNTKNIKLEGLYSHFATSGVMDPYWDKQVETFLNITSDVDYDEIPIIHFGRSLTLVQHEKLSFCNGIRLGIIMFGLSQSRKEGTSVQSKLRKMKREFYQKKYKCSKTVLENSLKLKTVMSLYSEVMSVREVNVGDVVGYNTFEVKESGYILTLPIGYADGVDKSFGNVAVEGNLLPIVSDCMDMIMVFSPKYYEVGTKVEIFGDKITIPMVTRKIGMNAYHLFNQISHRVLRIHKNENDMEEIYY